MVNFNKDPYSSRSSRIRWMKNESPLAGGKLRIGGVWGMTWGMWKRTGESSYTLTPFNHGGGAPCNCIASCKNYAADARGAGFTVKLLPAVDAPAIPDHP